MDLLASGPVFTLTASNSQNNLSYFHKATELYAGGGVMDFLSGDLDRVFTALFELGMIEPMLNKNWRELYKKSGEQWTEVSRAIHRLNRIDSLKEMRHYLETLPQDVIEALVIEVAREMAAFQEREETIH